MEQLFLDAMDSTPSWIAKGFLLTFLCFLLSWKVAVVVKGFTLACDD